MLKSAKTNVEEGFKERNKFQIMEMEKDYKAAILEKIDVATYLIVCDLQPSLAEIFRLLPEQFMTIGPKIEAAIDKSEEIKHELRV